MRPEPRPRNVCFAVLRRLAVATALVAVCPAAAIPAPADGLPAEYLPPDDPVWRDLEHLWNRGDLPGLPLFTRPLARVDLARSLRAALEARPELAGDPPVRRLQRELAFELAALGSPGPYRETPPPMELLDEGTRLRVQAEGRSRLELTDDEGEVMPGTAISLVARVYFPGGLFALSDAGIEKIVDANPLGDSIVKGSDWYLSTTASYVSLRTQALEAALGLSRNRWGPGTTGTLLLSDAALSYPALFYGRTFGKRMRFVAVTADLHQTENRWFSAHRLELMLGESLHLGFHESADYRSSGPDLLYVSGLVPYTLVQRFLDRTATEGEPVTDHRNNVMAGADFAWRFARGWRLDGEMLLDDLATESSKQPHRLAFQAGLSWSGRLLGQTADARAELVKVYRYTYATYYGVDHIHDGMSLGYADGPDVEHATVFLERDFGTDRRAGVGAELVRRGEGALGEFWDPGDPQSQNSGATLSGTVESRVFPHLRGELLWRDVARLRARLGALVVRNTDHVRDADETAVQGSLEAAFQW